MKQIKNFMYHHMQQKRGEEAVNDFLKEHPDAACQLCDFEDGYFVFVYEYEVAPAHKLGDEVFVLRGEKRGISRSVREMGKIVEVPIVNNELTKRYLVLVGCNFYTCYPDDIQ